MNFCIYDDILDLIQITDKKLYCILTKSGQILHVDKICFPRPGYIYTHIHSNSHIQSDSNPL